jgi:hypothetical protein
LPSTLHKSSCILNLLHEGMMSKDLKMHIFDTSVQLLQILLWVEALQRRICDFSHWLIYRCGVLPFSLSMETFLLADCVSVSSEKAAIWNCQLKQLPRPWDI